MTSKYQRPISTYIGNAALANRSKYQTDAASQPKVAISSDKIDSDFNYIIDTLNTVDEASGTAGSIAGRLDLSLNADGSLKASASTVMDDWVSHTLTNLARVGDTSFSCGGDQTATYTVNARVLIMLPFATVYATVQSSAFAASTTTVELTAITDASGTTAVIGVNPTAIKYSAIKTGFSGNTPDHFTTVHAESVKISANDASVRLQDAQAAGKEFAVRSTGGTVDFAENTGTEETPVWTSRAQVDSSGFVLQDASITSAKIAGDTVALSHLAHGTADKLIGFDATGVPVEVDQVQVAVASQTAAGIAEFATNTEVVEGTLTDKMVSAYQAKRYSAYRERSVSAEMTITPGADHAFNSGASMTNRAVNAWLVCKVADTTYAVGDKINLCDVDSASAHYGYTIRMRDSNDTAYVRVGSSGVILLNSSGSAYAPIISNFKLVIEILRG